MTLQHSTATGEDIQFYCHGMCHVFAVALHRRFGWSLLVVLNAEEHYWDDPLDADNFISSVEHVYAVDEALKAWDVLGVRPLSEVKDELGLDENAYDSDEVGSEEGLNHYVGCWANDGSSIDRPLVEYSDEDVVAADVVVLRVLNEVTGFSKVEMNASEDLTGPLTP